MEYDYWWLNEWFNMVFGLTWSETPLLDGPDEHEKQKPGCPCLA